MDTTAEMFQQMRLIAGDSDVMLKRVRSLRRKIARMQGKIRRMTESKAPGIAPGAEFSSAGRQAYGQHPHKERRET